MSDPLFLIFSGITILFFILMAIKSIAHSGFCALCVSISLSWVTLLLLFWNNIFNDPVILALLIGNSIVGIYYLLEKKTPERFHLFKFPFFLTLLFIGYHLLSPGFFTLSSATLGLLAALWILFGFLYAYRNHAGFNKIVAAVIACCKGW